MSDPNTAQGPQQANLLKLNRSNLDKIRVSIGGGRGIVTAIGNILRSVGFKKLTPFGNLGVLSQILADDLADLVFCDIGVEGGNIFSTIRAIRRQEIGKNPFTITFVLIKDTDVNAIRTYADSGVDDLIVVPVSTEALIHRLAVLANHRKPFVVTRDYIGPDRRSKERTEGEAIPRLNAPNIFQFLNDTGRGMGPYKDMVAKGSSILKDRWMERQAIQVAYLLEQGIPNLVMRSTDGEGATSSLRDELVAAVDAALSACKGSRYASEDVTFNTIKTVFLSAYDAKSPMPEDLDSLNKLARILRKTFTASHADQFNLPNNMVYEKKKVKTAPLGQ